ncbi:hypothetical protein GCM10022281_05900 [Sphingomonas rosea]|uniref:Uncharacterized protein n=1 Tax=Sphingomonas rosea TaxID=335605 RepID=A0ABP7TPY8_9SPHN
MRYAALAVLASATLLACRQEPLHEECVPALPGWRTTDAGNVSDMTPLLIELHGDQLSWNGMPVSEETFTEYLTDLETRLRDNGGSRKSPVFAVFSPETRNCALARQIRDRIDSKLPCRKGLCGLGPSDAFIKRVN